MLKIKRYYTALDRYRRSKGYGIHSPFAFRFVLKVLRERSGYYAYQTIRDGRNLALVRMVEEGISSRKVLSNKNARLIFRVVNFFNPSANPTTPSLHKIPVSSSTINSLLIDFQ